MVVSLSVTIAGQEKGTWLGAIGRIKDTLSNVKDGIAKLANMSGGFAGMISTAARNLGNKAIQWINDKIPNRLLPDNPIPGLFDQGGWLQPGQYGVNRTTQPEAVLTPSQWSSLSTLTSSSVTGARGLDGKALLAEQKAAVAATRAVVSELQRLRADLPTGIGSEVARGINGAVRHGQRSAG